MDFIEVSAKTVDDAITESLVKLGTTSDKIEYEVVEKGSSGFLGIGSRPAVIKVRKKSEIACFWQWIWMWRFLLIKAKMARMLM